MHEKPDYDNFSLAEERERPECYVNLLKEVVFDVFVDVFYASPELPLSET